MSKTQRTEALHQAARRYVLAKQAQQAIAQHNLDKLVRSGVIMTEPTVERTYENSVLCEPIWESEPGAAKKIAEIASGKHRGASGKALPPK